MTGVSHHKKHYQKSQGGKKEEKTSNPESDTPAMSVFREYSRELDHKHDKYERIVKLSRDITIASKRIIFSIHALLRSKNIEEDEKKISDSLKALRDNQFKAIAKELLDEDPYQYVRAYIWGVQEFVEALTFFSYVREGRFAGYEEVLKFLRREGGTEGEELPLLIPLVDYILGVEDLTGELMRHCIDSFAAGKSSNGVTTRDFARRIYSGLLMMYRLPNAWHDFSQKLTVAKQSLEKMEYATYSHHVRGSEAPSSAALVDVFADCQE